MLEMIKNWNGVVEINGTQFDTMSDALSKFDFKALNNGLCIILHPLANTPKIETINNEIHKVTVDAVETSKQIKIKVRQYMTKKSSPQFDFMKKWNNDVPMPMRVMVGEVVKETKGMVYMKLHGDIVERETQHCMCCGRTITNPISRYFGMGPECGGHNYVNPFENEDDLKQAVADYRVRLRDIKWEGWIIKSAIEEQEEVVINE